MARFVYKAFDAQGRRHSGEISARSERGALDGIAAKGLTAFDLAPAQANGERWWQREVHLFGDGLPRSDLADFLRALALMLDASIPLVSSLNLAAAEITHRGLKACLDQVQRDVEDGASLAGALAGHPRLIPERVLALIAIGEEANRLGPAAHQAAEMLAAEARTRREIAAALTYPAVLLIAALLVIAAVIFVLAPVIAPVFQAVRSDPPATIAAMLAIRGFLHDWWAVLVFGLCGMVAALLLLRGRGQSVLGALWLRVPILGPLWRDTEAARAMRSLHLLIEAGVTLPDALQVTARGAGRPVYRDLFDRSAEHVRAGGALGDVLADPGLIPSPVQQMIRIGAEANRLGPMLGHAASSLEDRVQRRTKAILQALTPALTIGIGLLVGLLIFSTLSAILEINDVALR